jgi:hypothetical protein
VEQQQKDKDGVIQNNTNAEVATIIGGITHAHKRFFKSHIHADSGYCRRYDGFHHLAPGYQFSASISLGGPDCQFHVGTDHHPLIQGTHNKVQRCLYCVLNTLIIFSVAVGAGVNVDAPPKMPLPPSAIIDEVSQKKTPVEKTLESMVLGVLGIKDAHANNVHDRRRQAEMELDRETGHAPKKQLTREEKEQLKKVYRQELKEYEEKMRAYSKRWSW